MIPNNSSYFIYLYIPKEWFPTIHHTASMSISQKNDSQQLDPLNWNNGAQHWPYLQNINPDPIFFHGKLRAVIPTPKSMVKDSCGWHETRQEPGVRALGGSFTGSKIGFNNPWRKMRIHSSWFNLENMDLTSENKDGSLLPMKNGI